MLPMVSLSLLLSAAVPLALADIHGVREAERVLSAPYSFAALELPLQLTDRAVVRRAHRT